MAKYEMKFTENLRWFLGICVPQAMVESRFLYQKDYQKLQLALQQTGLISHVFRGL